MEELIKRLERVIATGAPDKDGMHPISAETVLEVVNELSELSTNLAEVGTDLISRQAAIEALERAKQNIRHNIERAIGRAICEILDEVENGVKQLPPIQPDNGLQSLAEEIATFKRCVKSENSDYLTGYLCALSAVEGMIAERREVTT